MSTNASETRHRGTEDVIQQSTAFAISAAAIVVVTCFVVLTVVMGGIEPTFGHFETKNNGLATFAGVCIVVYFVSFYVCVLIRDFYVYCVTEWSCDQYEETIETDRNEIVEEHETEEDEESDEEFENE